MSKIIEPKGYYVQVEIAGHVLVRDGIDTEEFGRQMFNEIVERGGIYHAWLLHGKPTRPGSTIEEYTHAVIPATDPR